MMGNMKLKKLMACMVALLLLSMSVIGCGSKDNAADTESESAETQQGAEEAAGADAADDVVQIGVVWQDLSNEFILSMDNVAKAYSEYEYPDIEFTFLDSAGKIETQTSQIEGYITKQMDCIVIQSLDDVAITPVVKEAIAAGIPVVVTSLFEERVGEIFVGTELVQSGAVVAQYVADELEGKGNVAIIRGPIGHVAEIQRGEGFMEVFDQYPDINIVYDQTGNWSREEGMQLMENWIQTGTKIDAVCCQNDEMALGAIAALEAAGLLDETVVVGVDGIMDALDAVKAGKMGATALQDARTLVEAVLDAAVECATGGTATESSVDYPLITKDNADQWFANVEWLANPDYTALP